MPKFASKKGEKFRVVLSFVFLNADGTDQVKLFNK